MHNLNSIIEGGSYKYSGIKHYNGDYKDRHVAVAGDIIVANTEQGHEHRLIGFPAIVPSRYATAIYSHHLYRVRLKPGSPLRTSALYYTLMTPSVREQIIGCANGSTVNMLKAVGLEMPRFVCPPSSVAAGFEANVAPLRRQIEMNVDRAEKLSTLRDALLPRLISGKLRLPDAARRFAEVSA
jgi:type I restriction enzyme S subunit